MWPFRGLTTWDTQWGRHSFQTSSFRALCISAVGQLSAPEQPPSACQVVPVLAHVQPNLSQEPLCGVMGHHFHTDPSSLCPFISSSFHRYKTHLPPVFNEATVSSWSHPWTVLWKVPQAGGQTTRMLILCYVLFSVIAVLSGLCSIPGNSHCIYFVQFYSFLWQEEK